MCDKKLIQSIFEHLYEKRQWTATLETGGVNHVQMSVSGGAQVYPQLTGPQIAAPAAAEGEVKVMYLLGPLCSGHQPRLLK